MEKKKLIEVLKNPNDKLVCVDLDGTLCKGEAWNKDDDPKPIKERIDFINEKLYKKGAHIIIYTARRADMYQMTLAWLIKNGVLFHGICMRVKPGADLYIDDKALNTKDINWGEPTEFTLTDATEEDLKEKIYQEYQDNLRDDTINMGDDIIID